MANSALELAGLVLTLIGLIGASASTGMPMWRVTAFIGENIIVMETRWEGLWMNCYRQANIRMQCKVYDSLLYLPPDLQAARGLMCCSLALSGLALLLALAGMRCTSCIEENERAKSIVLLVAGGMQVVSSICVFVPVSWTGNVIIRDFYNPLLIDAQRRELGEALYIGWVTGALLFASGLLFCCRRVPSHKESFDIYHPDNMRPALMRFQPVSSVRGSARSQQPLIQNRSFNGNAQASPFVPNVPLMNPQEMYNPGLVNNIPVQYSGGFSHHPPSTQSSSFVGSLSSPGNPLYFSQTTTPYAVDHLGNPSMSYSSGFQAIPQNTVFLGYNHSRAVPHSGSQSSAGVYI